MKTVKEVSELTGISARTLHYYDEIGLFPPSGKSEAGYRLYDDKALKILQQILFFREFDIPLKEIKTVMGILTAITVLTGVEGVINSISFVVPFLLISVICISAHSILNTPLNLSAAVDMEQNRLIANWFLSSILYVSYNTMLSVSVLGALGTNARNQKALKNGAILGGLGLGLASVLIFLALCGNLSGISKLEIPMRIFRIEYLSYCAKFRF